MGGWVRRDLGQCCWGSCWGDSHDQGGVLALEASLGRGPAGHVLGGAAGSAGAGTTLGARQTCCPGAAVLSALSPGPIKACPVGFKAGGEGGPLELTVLAVPWTVDRCWAAGPSRAASVPVQAETPKQMKTTTASSRPSTRALPRAGPPASVVSGAWGQGQGWRTTPDCQSQATLGTSWTSLETFGKLASLCPGDRVSPGHVAAPPVHSVQSGWLLEFAHPSG